MTSGRRRFCAVLLCAPALACGRHRDAPAGTGEDGTRRPPSDPAPDPPAGTSGSTSSPPVADEPPAVDELEGLEPALAATLSSLRERFEGRGFTILAEPPFAVVGDGSPAQVRRHAATTIRWAVDHLEAAYFEAPPTQTVTIYLFETARSYEDNARALFGEGPDTPYGYYSPTHHALVMNISTGGGTLVHEIVHPYMAANFPRCPSWFDEGLASLYEQSAEREGRIVGLTNWRLEGLQDALSAGRVPSFRELCESGRGFYTRDPGSNYAQARYLCYWLQEQGRLRRFYREFRARVELDPTGYDTLFRFVGPDMAAFRAQWERFVLGLRFP